MSQKDLVQEWTGSLLIGTALTSPSSQPKDRKLTMSMDIQTWKPPHPIKIPSQLYVDGKIHSMITRH